MGILTGGIIQPLNVSWRIFFKIGKDILGTHLIYSTNVDGLQSHFGDCYKKKEKEKEKRQTFPACCVQPASTSLQRLR